MHRRQGGDPDLTTGTVEHTRRPVPQGLCAIALLPQMLRVMLRCQQGQAAVQPGLGLLVEMILVQMTQEHQIRAAVLQTRKGRQPGVGLDVRAFGEVKHLIGITHHEGLFPLAKAGIGENTQACGFDLHHRAPQPTHRQGGRRTAHGGGQQARCGNRNTGF